MTVSEQLERYASMTDEKLRQLMAGGEQPDILRESMSYSLFAGGKRLRPALCLAACELTGGDVQSALLPACAVEMIHCYSLIHDDLPALDNDALRRGKPSNHMVFGEANAIIAGDGLQALAFHTAAAAENVRVLSALAEGAFDMVAGQSYDLTAGEDANLLPTIHRLKTGALIKAAVLCGAYCGEPTSRELYMLERFSEQFGLLFQITDDILDAEGDAAELGKTTGKDAEEHKLTFVGCYGLAGAREHAAEAARLAREALEGFSERAWFLTGLLDMTEHRRK